MTDNFTGTSKQMRDRADAIVTSLSRGDAETAQRLLVTEAQDLRRNFRDPSVANAKMAEFVYEVTKRQNPRGNGPDHLVIDNLPGFAPDGQSVRSYFVAQSNGRSFDPVAINGRVEGVVVPENQRSRVQYDASSRLPEPAPRPAPVRPQYETHLYGGGG